MFSFKIEKAPQWGQCHKLKGKSHDFPFFRFTFHSPSVKLRDANPVNTRIQSKTGKFAVKLRAPPIFVFCAQVSHSKNQQIFVKPAVKFIC
jgi:hypothetical protein